MNSQFCDESETCSCRHCAANPIERTEDDVRREISAELAKVRRIRRAQELE